MSVSSSAGVSTSVGDGSFTSTWPLRENLTLSTTRGVAEQRCRRRRLPPFANVAYARVMSSGLTASWPRPIEKNGSSLLRMPSACAVATTAFGVTTCVSCA